MWSDNEVVKLRDTKSGRVNEVVVRRGSTVVSLYNQFYSDVKLQTYQPFNWLYPSCFEPRYDSEAKGKVFIKKISFH